MATRNPRPLAYKSVHPYKSLPATATAKMISNEQEQSPKVSDQVPAEFVGNISPQVASTSNNKTISTPKNMAATSVYFATPTKDENEQCHQVADDEVKNMINEGEEEQAAVFQELGSGMEEANLPTQPKIRDADALDQEFMGLIQQLEEKRLQDKLLMDQLASFLRSKTEDIITVLEKSFQDMHQTTNEAVQRAGDDFYEELDKARRLEANMIAIQHRVRTLFENLQSFLPCPKMEMS